MSLPHVLLPSPAPPKSNPKQVWGLGASPKLKHPSLPSPKPRSSIGFERGLLPPFHPPAPAQIQFHPLQKI